MRLHSGFYSHHQYGHFLLSGGQEESMVLPVRFPWILCAIYKHTLYQMHHKFSRLLGHLCDIHRRGLLSPHRAADDDLCILLLRFCITFQKAQEAVLLLSCSSIYNLQSYCPDEHKDRLDLPL